MKLSLSQLRSFTATPQLFYNWLVFNLHRKIAVKGATDPLLLRLPFPLTRTFLMWFDYADISPFSPNLSLSFASYFLSFLFLSILSFLSFLPSFSFFFLSIGDRNQNILLGSFASFFLTLVSFVLFFFLCWFPISFLSWEVINNKQNSVCPSWGT